MKPISVFSLMLVLAALLVACAAPAPVSAPTAPAAELSPAAATIAVDASTSAAAPGLPAVCAANCPNKADCPNADACAADCPRVSCGAAESCPNKADCPNADACAADCPRVSCGAAESCPNKADCPNADACAADPYNACVDEPVCGVAPGATNEGCMVTSDMLQAAAVGVYQKLTAAQAKARMDSGDPVIILDVRTQAEYEAGHIPGAILIPNESITTERPARLDDTSAEILVYCRSGRRSKEAVEKMVNLGYTNVYDFGGVIDWPYETVTGGEKAV